jgi:hypothetical protein
MPDYVNTTTLQLHKSMTESDAAGLTMLTRDELNAAHAIASHYRKWTGSAVAEMTQGEKDTVDAAAVQARKDSDEQTIDDDERLKATIRATHWLVERIHGGTPTTQAEYITKIKSEVQLGI